VCFFVFPPQKAVTEISLKKGKQSGGNKNTSFKLILLFKKTTKSHRGTLTIEPPVIATNGIT
jgi:hypothetical protein